MLIGTWAIHLTCKADRVGGPAEQLLRTIVESGRQRAETWLADDGAILGRMWRDIGSQPPKNGTEYFHKGLAKLLAAGVTDIPREKVMTLRISSLRMDNFIHAGKRYFQPAEVDVLRPPAVGCTTHSK